MSNIIDKIQLSGVTYDIGGQGGSGVSVVEVTQAEYDALPSSAKTDTSKMYVITDAQAGDLTQYWTSAETQSAITQAVSGKVDSSDVYLKSETSGATEISTALGNKQDALVSGTNIKTINNESLLGSGNIDIQGGGSSYTAGDGIDITNNVISVTGKADTSAVTAVSNDLAIHTSNGVIHVTSADKSAWNAKSDFSGSYNDLTDKPTIPTVPTSNTAFTNDAGYITSGEAQTQIVNSISGKVDTTTYNTYTAATDAALATKQTTLTAGTNITIVDNVISATGGGGGGVTIDPTLDSGSTNPVANSAITEAVLVPNYRQLVKAEDEIAFPNASALYIEAINLEGYYTIYLSGSSSETQRLYVISFAQHMIDGELSYVNYEWQTDNSLILTPKTSGNYFYMVHDTWDRENVYAIYDFASGTSSSVIQNEIYPRIIDLEGKVVNLQDTKVTNVSYNPLYNDYGGYWYHEIEVYDNVGGRYTALAKLKYDDFGYDNNDGIIYTKKTTGATSGSTDCITSGGVYEILGDINTILQNI